MKIYKIFAALAACVILFGACNDEEFLEEASAFFAASRRKSGKKNG